MHRDNHKYRRMVERLPTQMTILMRHLTRPCTVLAHHAGSMGWRVDFEIQDTPLTLVYDRGTLELTMGTGQGPVRHFSTHTNTICGTPVDLANEVNQAFAKNES